MKLKNLFLAAMTLFAFAACTETPDAPYDFPGTGGGSGSGNTPTNGYPYISETFSTSLGAFKTTETVGNFAWKHETYNGNGYAKVSGYANGASQNAESWLIAPAIDLTNETKAYISFDYVINKGEVSAAATNHKVVVTENYTGDVKTTEWTEIDFRATNNGSWTFNSTGKIALPTEMIGKNSVVIAFKYISSSATSSTWEMNNLLVDGEVGADEAPSTDENEPTIEGDNLLANSDFETWENGVPTGWAQTVTNCTYTQSTEAHSGSSAVVIEGYSQSNKRFASKSYTLKPGTYTIGAYLKKSGDAFGQYRLGYAKLTNGVVADTQNDYIYITSAAQVPAEWNRATCSFTVNEETEVGIIIMNSKYGEGASILVDDVTLTTTDGGLVEGTDEPETPEGSYINETFATSFGSFTTQETIGNFPWVIDYSCAKATAYESATKKNNAAESWLVSQAIDLTSETEAYIAFDYVIRFTQDGKVASHNQLLITEDFTGDVATATWKVIGYNAKENPSDWTFGNSGKIAIPAEFIGKSNVRIAFKYTSTETKAGTWEVKNVIVAHGAGETAETPEEPETPETPDTPVVPDGDNLLANGSFEDWSDGIPAHWATLKTSNASISQSTDAHTGNYSVIVEGAKTNKRLASKSYTLSAGTYTLSAYVKANGADAGYCRLGYVTLAEGAAVQYVYDEETPASAAPADWTAKVYEFTLTEETELALVLMNHKDGNGASYLVDDVTLTSTDGSVSGGESGDEEGEEPETPAGTSSIADVLAAGAGQAEIQGTIIATYSRGFLVNDGTASILVYLGDNKGLAKGDVVKVKGTTSMYGGLLQFGNGSTVTKTGTASVSEESATSWNGADMDAYINSPSIKYVEYTGTLSISGYYYNVTVDGASTAVGSIAYPADGLVDASLDGKKITVRGYAIGVSGTKYINTMATSVTEAK